MPTPRKYASNAERQSAYRRRLSSQMEGRQKKQSGSGAAGTPPRPGYRRWDTMLAQARSLTAMVVSEMAGYYEARSDGWQGSLRGESFAEKLEALEEIAALMAESESTQPEP